MEEGVAVRGSREDRPAQCPHTAGCPAVPVRLCRAGRVAAPQQSDAASKSATASISIKTSCACVVVALIPATRDGARHSGRPAYGRFSPLNVLRKARSNHEWKRWRQITAFLIELRALAGCLFLLWCKCAAESGVACKLCKFSPRSLRCRGFAAAQRNSNYAVTPLHIGTASELAASVKTLASKTERACRLSIVPFANGPKSINGTLTGGQKNNFFNRGAEVDDGYRAAAPGLILSIPSNASLGSPRVGTIHVQSPTPHAPALQAFLVEFSQQPTPFSNNRPRFASGFREH